MSREVARREVRRAVEARWTRSAFAARAAIDPGTLGDFLDGKRWPQGGNRTKIENALDWPIGAIADMADGLPVPQALRRGGDPVVTSRNPAPEAEVDRHPVGGEDEAASYVAGGDRVDRPSLSDMTLAELAAEQRRIADEMTRRLADEGA